MKIIFTETALSDLDEIFEYLASNYPTLVGPVEQRINSVLARLQDWPKSARKSISASNRPRRPACSLSLPNFLSHHGRSD
jgi:plasmid stabilization system protein ParE